ncbi:hypothetical protein SeMB42_g03450 [Synchytrium endobioticum]|uniref:Uncharacterized protein n=1 Tax=Synchytrium endobioticum TaxID=286115 RepID=A0A507D6I3_9FUNG|nr:hypothetical protein SeMB42_g03450 [Synchytrium endobioticum]
MTTFVLSRAMRSLSTMLTCFIIVLVLWQQVLPATAETTDAQYKRYAEQLRRDRLEMTIEKQEQLQNNLLTMYTNGNYIRLPNCNQGLDGSDITQITDLLILSTISFNIKDATQKLWNSVADMSQRHNEFVWELFQALHSFASFLERHVIHPVHKTVLQYLLGWPVIQESFLNVQIRQAMGGSHKFFEDFPHVGMIDLHAKIEQVKEVWKR